MAWNSSRFGRPPRWMRILSMVLAVVFALRLIGAHEPLDIFSALVLVGLGTLFAVSPRALYDGRAAAWEQAHPVLAALALFVFLSVLMFNALIIFVSPWVSALISAGFSAVFAPWAVRRSRVRSR